LSRIGRDMPLAGGDQRKQEPRGPSFGRSPGSPWVGSIPPIPWAEVENPRLPTVSILLPALNEEGGVEAVLRRIPRKTLQRRGLAYSVYVLDGRSTDRTRSVAKRFGAEIFVQTGRGKGSAFREFVPRIHEDFAVLLDSDGTYPPELIPDLVGALRKGSSVVLGSRLDGSIAVGAMSMANYVGNRLLSRFASLLFNTPISDVCSGMWAFRSEQLKSLGLTADGFDLEADIFAECALKRIPITEIGIRYDRRVGKGKLRMKEGVRIAFALLRKRIRSSMAQEPGTATAALSRWIALIRRLGFDATRGVDTEGGAQGER